MGHLQRREHAPNFLEIPRGRSHELRVARAELDAVFFQQPPRQPPHLPLRARVRAGPQNDPQAFLLRQPAELGGVLLPLPVELAFLPLVVVPKQVDAHGVQPHRVRHFQAVLPVFVRHAGKMDLAAPDHVGLSVEQEILRPDGKHVHGGRGGRGQGAWRGSGGAPRRAGGERGHRAAVANGGSGEHGRRKQPAQWTHVPSGWQSRTCGLPPSSFKPEGRPPCGGRPSLVRTSGGPLPTGAASGFRMDWLFKATPGPCLTRGSSHDRTPSGCGESGGSQRQRFEEVAAFVWDGKGGGSVGVHGRREGRGQGRGDGRETGSEVCSGPSPRQAVAMAAWPARLLRRKVVGPSREPACGRRNLAGKR